MHTSDSFDRMKCADRWYLTGMPVEVHLSEPLGGRALFDGSQFLPEDDAHET